MMKYTCVLLGLILFYACRVIGVSVPNYYAQPQTPNFVQDANTTFLINFGASVKTNADYAAGVSALTVTTNLYSTNGYYSGTLGFFTTNNFPTNAFTVEMMIQLPYVYSTNTSIPLQEWTNSVVSFRETVILDTSGLDYRPYYYSGTGFSPVMACAANGVDLQTSGVDRWVYVAYGMDMVNQLGGSMLRETNGDLIAQNIQFIPTYVLNSGYWTNALNKYGSALPGLINYGGTNTGLLIKSLKVSNIYRTNLFQVLPILPVAGTTNWVPAQYSGAVAATNSTTSTVGYNGFNNFVNQTVTNIYAPLYLGGTNISFTITNITRGLYSVYLYGQTAPNGRSALQRVWNPCPLDFSATDAGGTQWARGRLLSKQGFILRRLQGFHFHYDNAWPTNMTLSFQVVATNAMETNWVENITLFNELAYSPLVSIKNSQNFGLGTTNQDSSFSSAQQAVDDVVWSNLPPLNVQMVLSTTYPGYDGNVTEFDVAPTNNIAPWFVNGWTNIIYYNVYNYPFVSLDMLNSNNMSIFTGSNLLANVPWPTTYPDDGTGYFFGTNNFPWMTQNIYWQSRAEWLGYRYMQYFATVVNSAGSLGSLNLPGQYFTNSAAITNGHVAAIALARIAYDWPAMEAMLFNARYSTQNPDLDYNDDWTDSPIENGKIRYVGWSGTDAMWLFQAYDELFPYIQNNQTFANALHRYVPWVNTPADVIYLFDNYLVVPSVRDIGRGLVDGSVGVELNAGQLLGPSIYTQPFFDLTSQTNVTYPIQGTFQEMYGTANDRQGTYYAGSFEVYCRGSAQTLLGQAWAIKSYKNQGFTPTMDISNVQQFGKIAGAGNLLMNLWIAGGYPFMAGDSSGGPHWAPDFANRISTSSNELAIAFFLTGDPRYASLLTKYTANGIWLITNSARVAGVLEPVSQSQPRVIPTWGVLQDMVPGDTNILHKTTMTMRLGMGSGHSHSDYLDENFFAFGLPMAVDLACRNEGTFWSRPGADWAFLHNHVITSDDVTDNPSGAGSQFGEPWLRSFAAPSVRGSYVGTNMLERDTIMMEVGTGSQTFYAFDVQRVTNGFYHTWCFHGAESSNLVLNIPVVAQTNRWLDRLNDNTQFVATQTTNMLQALWTMTRAGTNWPFSFNGGGTITTVGAEPAALGSLYNSGLPPANFKATLLGRTNDVVMYGDPFSQVYDYCFPFLWSQTSNEVYSVYPAVYEWYRGTSTVASVTYSSIDPVRVEVTTTSGQVDDYYDDQNCLLAISHDALGIRWAQLSGSTNVNSYGLVLNPATNYYVQVIAMNHLAHTLTTSGPLPSNPAVCIGTPSRQIWLQLYGSGTNFTFTDDLLAQEGYITSLHVTSTNTIAITSDQAYLFDGEGNRKSSGMTVATEDDLWQFRNNTVVSSPAGVPLTTFVFTDYNNDGLIDMKTYECGVGDWISLPAAITIVRKVNSLQINSNVAVSGSCNGFTFNVPAFNGWQGVDPTGASWAITNAVTHFHP